MSKYTNRRHDVVAAAKNWSLKNIPKLDPIKADINLIFGSLTFNMDTMKNKLPQDVYHSLTATIEKKKHLDPKIADTVALAMKNWAIENGATHFTHWFQPLTGYTAEKHESFITPNVGGGAIAQFSGKDLIQGEPDASSFPSGGLRATFEARGYTAWDPTSPAFIIKNHHGATLCIPTAFASWNGEALDHKTPLLRSLDALNTQALEALRLFDGRDVHHVFVTVGAEQEYFLIDEEFYFRRPDLVTTGRTLFGAKPPRGQELDDHYFGSIPERVLAYMTDVEYQLYQLAVPVKTRHNEVAPGQYEIAPIFENCNVSADHQQLIMQTLRNTARKYGLVCLLHEKPFVGVNGSGKHNNWSLMTDTGHNLLEPGETPHDNMAFLFFCVAIIKAVDQHQDLVRASIASAANDHRLGKNEAPPAIISIFLGKQLTDVFEQIENGQREISEASGLLGLGTPSLPAIPRHLSDRNRTSPFAFTGDKFEFRAVGASQSISFPNTVLNTIVAESLRDMTNQIKDALATGKSVTTALREVLSQTITKHKRIIFNGDGYSTEWREEAKKRGLLNFPNTLDALAQFCSPKNITLFERHHVMDERELHARKEIYLEQYFKTINIEAETTEAISRTNILPGAINYLNDLAATYQRVSGCDLDSVGVKKTLNKLNDLVNDFEKTLEKLNKVNVELGGDSISEKAYHMRDHVLPEMEAVRIIANQLEKIVPENYWPMPTYQEMLFVR